MATSGLYGNTAASVVALPSGSETSGLYGNNTVFGGTYFEYFIFQDAATQPATPTGGSWSFTTNVGTPPTGWSNNPPASPTYKVWISIALVNSKSGSTLTWSTPGVMATTAAGTVTSVGLSAPSFLSVSGSPVTSSGTLALTYSGAALPVANGGTGTTTPNLVAGTNVSITGTWPNQTINSTNPGGTVTSVTATSPVSSTGGTTPVISMPAATTSVSGYLTSTDWNTFNSKGSGTVTSVTGTAPVVSSGGTTPAISMPAATSSVSGYLTNTDWTTFNNKGSVTSVAATVPSFLSVSGSPITSSGTLAISYSGAALPVANGGTGTSTPSLVAGTNVTISGTWPNQTINSTGGGGGGMVYPGAGIPLSTGTAWGTSYGTTGSNSVVLRDANQNISANSISEGYSNVAAAGTTTVLTVSSVPNYVITGSGGQTYQLPDATTLPSGVNYTFNNNQSSGTIVVKNNSGTTITTVQAGGFVDVSLLSNAISAGSWDVHNFAPSNVSWSTNTFDYAGSITSATWNGIAIALNRGGTGASTAAGARTNLGLGTISTQDASAVAITGGTIDGTTVGGTTPAAGSFTTLIGGAGSTNYGQLTGGATTKAVQFQTLSATDTNISFAIQPKGTGAIDLAAGSSGVNISNGGTVTAITRTASGSGYSYPITITVSAPTTAGGVQAQISLTSYGSSTASVVSGGTGYTNGDTLTIVGGTPSGAATYTVTGVTGGVITSVSALNSGAYTTPPANPVSVTGGTGSGATFNLTYYVPNTFSITNAGSGYIEQPTVTFSGGGGSGAAAYASVGSGTKITSLAGTGEVWTSSGRQLIFGQAATTPTTVWTLYNDSFARSLLQGSGTTGISSGGTSNLSFFTNSTAQEQLRVSHTASAVNYVQVTGAATTTSPTITFTGSDGGVGGIISSKGNGGISIFNNSSASRQLRVGNGGVTSAVNWVTIDGSIATNAPKISVDGSDTDIDLTLTPKGAGRVNITTSIKPKVNSAANVTSPLAWNSTSYDEYAITALANALTINADANASPADGQKMMFRFKDNGTARALTWTTGSTNSFRVVGVTLPTTTVASKLVYVGCIYNAADSRWDAVAVSQEA